MTYLSTHQHVENNQNPHNIYSLGLKINLKKTKIMKITRNNNSVQVIGESLEDVDTFKYVGSMDFKRYGRGYYYKKN